jgi:hypothetical protein
MKERCILFEGAPDAPPRVRLILDGFMSQPCYLAEVIL